MFKVVVIGGKLRGQEFTLQEGENVVGRDSSASIIVSTDGISKRHLSFTLHKGLLVVEDLGSANGTFVNGKITKKAQLKAGDKVSIPDTIFQVVAIKEIRKIVKKKVLTSAAVHEEEDTFTKPPPPPSSPFGKILYLFRYKIMPILHGINHEYEWRYLVGILVSIFILVTITLTIFPVLESSQNRLLSEVAKRGDLYAEEIARLNSIALANRSLDRIDTAFLEREAKQTGIDSYELFDLEGRIVRPLGKLNEYISDTFSIKAKEWAEKSGNDGSHNLQMMLGEGRFGIAKKILAYDAKSGSTDPVGIIAIQFAPASLVDATAKNRTSYIEALTTSAFVAIVFFGLIYYLTVRPLEEIKFQIEESLRGKIQTVEPKLLMSETKPLVDTINSMLQRIREMSGDAAQDNFGIQEDDAMYVNTLLEMMKGAAGGALVLNSEKKIKGMTLASEDLLGIRKSAAEGVAIIDVIREQGLAGSLIELCDLSAANNGTNQSSGYELTGRDYKIHVSSLIGKDSFAKAYYITFVQGD